MYISNPIGIQILVIIIVWNCPEVAKAHFLSNSSGSALRLPRYISYSIRIQILKENGLEVP